MLTYIFDTLKRALQHDIPARWDEWAEVPAHLWWVIWPVLLICVSAYPLVIAVPVIRERVASRFDRLFLAPIVGFFYYMFVLMVLNALFGVPIGAVSFYILFVLTSLAGWGWIVWRRVEWAGRWRHTDWIVLAGLLFVFFLAGATRLSMTHKYPERLLDSDPYRHYPRTESIVRTGDLNKWEPWLTGEVPIYEVQGCYVLAAIFSTVSGVDSWTVWKFGSTIIGAWSAITWYLFSAYFVPGRPRRFVGVVACACLAALPVHITRTNMGFSVPWALPFLSPTLLFIVWSFRYNSFSAGVLYGCSILAMALSNMVPVSMMVVFLIPFCGYQLLRRVLYDLLWKTHLSRGRNGGEAPTFRDWIGRQMRPFGGLAAGSAVFLCFIGIWQMTYAGVPISVGSRAHSKENMDIMANVLKEAKEEERKYREELKKTPPRNFGEKFDKVVADITGRHNQEILRKYMLRSNFIWGCLGVIVTLLLPSADRRLGAPPASGVWEDARVGWGSLVGTAAPGERPILPWRRPGGWPPGEWLDARVFLLLFFALPLTQFALLPYLLENSEELGFRTFTGRSYRYLVLPAHCLSFGIAFALVSVAGMIAGAVQWCFELFAVAPSVRAEQRAASRAERRAKERKKRKKRRGGVEPAKEKEPEKAEAPEEEDAAAVPVWTRVTVGGVRWTLLFLVVFTAFQATLYGKSFGNWPPTSREPEERALEWMIEALPDDARIVCNWFNADFVRTYTAQAGKPLYSLFSKLRTNIAPAQEEEDLDIPELGTVEKMLEYAEETPGNYYVMTTRYGPRLPRRQRDKHFNLIATFPGGKDTVSIWAFNTNPVAVEPREETEPVPIGDSQLGELRSLGNINDGSAGANNDWEAASTDPIQRKPHWAWFGLRYPKPTVIRGAQVHFGWFRDPTKVRDNRGRQRFGDLMYVANDYVIQYHDGEKWTDIPGTRVRDNDRFLVRHRFEPITTDRIRVYTFSQYNRQFMRGDDVRRNRGFFRATCLEFDPLEEGEEDFKEL